MKTIFFSNETRGTADHGWLKAKFSFSFGQFFDPNRIQFGKIRVFNDDIIDPGMGFGTHPHSNMEIISIPLSGALAHKDSLGHESIINTGEVQVMSAGTGIHHSEYNPSATEITNLFQIWLFPDTENVTPRYDQKTFLAEAEKNTFLTVVAPKDKVENALWIHQDAYFNLATIDHGETLKYSLRNTKSGVYALLISGSIQINDHILNAKDALGISETSEITVTANSNARILLIETPME